MSGIKAINDPTNKSVIEGSFDDKDSLHGMNPNRRAHSKNRILKPLVPQSELKPRIDNELDQISTINIHM